MNNLFGIYHRFFNDGDIDKFISSLKEIGEDTSEFEEVAQLSEEYMADVRVVAEYINKYRFDTTFSSRFNNGKSIHEAVISGAPYVRLSLLTQDIEAIIAELNRPENMPRITIDSSLKASVFDGVLKLRSKQSSDTYALIYDAVCTMLFGMPMLDISLATNLKRNYILSNQILQCVLYGTIGSDTCKEICKNLIRSGMTALEWCLIFDDIWFDVDDQIKDGFIVLFNPKAPKKFTCISTLYNGKFFNTNINAFKELYENGFLETVRFVDREVPVESVAADGKTSVQERMLNVPVFYDDDEECLVSDLTSRDYVYSSVFYTDVGRI